MTKIEGIKKWVKALRSGEYQQGMGMLQSSMGFCCLGVLCDITIPKKKRKLKAYNDTLFGGVVTDQRNAPKWAKNIASDFVEKTGVDLVMLNDIKGYSFDEIADCIELVYIHNAVSLD